MSLDDFGSAYANMALLIACPFNEIKIDKTIIDSIVSSKTARTLVQSVVQICEDIGAECLVEGVEIKEQADCVQNLGCHKVQGYYLGKPMDTLTFEHKFL